MRESGGQIHEAKTPGVVNRDIHAHHSRWLNRNVGREHIYRVYCRRDARSSALRRPTETKNLCLSGDFLRLIPKETSDDPGTGLYSELPSTQYKQLPVVFLFGIATIITIGQFSEISKEENTLSQFSQLGESWLSSNGFVSLDAATPMRPIHRMSPVPREH